MPRLNLVERKFSAFLRTSLSVRNAMAVIVTATLLSVIVGGVAITLLDSDEFPDVGTGLWWALQTVTTVGYGDVTPQNTIGRLVGAVFMLESIAFIAIVTAAITSSFVERSRRELAAQSSADGSFGPEQLAAQIADLTAAVERIQLALGLEGSTETSRPTAPQVGTDAGG
jgi:voltage-gated potassium channel